MPFNSLFARSSDMPCGGALQNLVHIPGFRWQKPRRGITGRFNAHVGVVDVTRDQCGVCPGVVTEKSCAPGSRYNHLCTYKGKSSPASREGEPLFFIMTFDQPKGHSLKIFVLIFALVYIRLNVFVDCPLQTYHEMMTRGTELC